MTVTADGQTEVSRDGVNFSPSVSVTRTNTSPATIFVRGFDDSLEEGVHSGTITQAITSSSDPYYPLGPIGNPVTATISYDELQPVVGIDFGGSSASSPANWTFVSNSLGTNLADLVREDGLATSIDFSMPSRSTVR